MGHFKVDVFYCSGGVVIRCSGADAYDALPERVQLHPAEASKNG